MIKSRDLETWIEKVNTNQIKVCRKPTTCVQEMPQFDFGRRIVQLFFVDRDNPDFTC